MDLHIFKAAHYNKYQKTGSATHRYRYPFTFF